jgi:hypothetical protein
MIVELWKELVVACQKNYSSISPEYLNKTVRIKLGTYAIHNFWRIYLKRWMWLQFSATALYQAGGESSWILLQLLVALPVFLLPALWSLALCLTLQTATLGVIDPFSYLERLSSTFYFFSQTEGK